MAKLVSKLGEEGKIAIRQALLWCHLTGTQMGFLSRKQSAGCWMREEWSPDLAVSSDPAVCLPACLGYLRNSWIAGSGASEKLMLS